MTHGAYVPPVKLGERVHAIAAAVRPYLPAYSPGYEPLLTGYAIALTRVERAVVALETADAKRDPERHEKLARETRGWLSTVARYASELGLSPASAARIAKDAGIGAAAVAAHAELLERYRGAA